MAASNKKLTELLDARFMARLDGLDVVSRKILQGKLQGERRSKRRGQSVEFADHRAYVEGDDLRFIDWNIYGRLEQLVLKLFLEEQDLGVEIMVDLSSSVAYGEPSKELFLKRLAAALAYVALVNNNRVGLYAFADGVTRQLVRMRGRTHLPQIAELLLGQAAEGPSQFEKACQTVAAARMGTGIVIVLSDFLFKEGYEQGLRRLSSRNFDLYAIQVLSPQELNPPFAGDMKLVDLEDSDSAEITTSAALIQRYKRTLSAYCSGLKDFATHRGGAYMLANSKDPVESLVLNALRRQGLLR